MPFGRITFARGLALLTWLVIASSQGLAQNKDGYLDSGVRHLDGEFNGAPSWLQLNQAHSEPVEQGVPNLGNSGTWSWLSLNYPNPLGLEQSLEVATSLVDSLVLVSACRGVEEGVRLVRLGGANWDFRSKLPLLSFAGGDVRGPHFVRGSEVRKANCGSPEVGHRSGAPRAWPAT